MKKYLHAALLAASCNAAAAAEAVAVRTTANSLPPQVHLALEALQKEYDARLEPAKGLPVRVELPSAAGYTDAQKAALRAVFGTEDALDVKRLPGKGPTANYAMRIPGHAYDYAGTHSTWSDAAIQIKVGAGNATSSTGTWPGIKADGGSFSFAVQDVSFSQRQGRDPVSGLKLGAGQVKAARIDVDDKSSTDGAHFRAENTSAVVSVARQGKSIEQKFDFFTKRLTAGAVGIDDVHFAIRLRDLNAATLKKFEDEAKSRKRGDMTDPERSAAAIADMGRFFKALVLQGANLDISDISAGYGGNRLQIKGSIGMPGATEQDLSSAASALNKVSARFDIKLPLPMLRSIAHGVMRMANKGKADDLEMASNMYQLMLGKALSEGYARLDKEVLVSEIELKNGKLRINGKEQAFSIADMLKLLDKHAPPPPEDHSVPVEVRWRDRKLDHVSLFAGNGLPVAMRELCRRYTDGDGALKDGELALKWCGASEEQARKQPAAEPDGEVPPAAAPPNDGRTIHYRVKGGFYDTSFYRFDEGRMRSLDIKLENPRQHDKWAPMVSLCLTAEAPSDSACLGLSRDGKGSDQLRAMTSLLATDSKARRDGAQLNRTLPMGTTIHVQVYVRGGQAHFIVDGDELVQDVVFPVELIQLVCSTGDCSYQFN